MTFFSQPNLDWCIVEDKFDIKKNRHYESVFSLGTGYMTTRASIDEGFSDDDQSVEYTRYMDNTTLEKTPESKSRWGSFIPVVQADHPTLRVGIVNLPYYLGLIPWVDGERLDLESCSIRNYLRWLDLKTGTLYRFVNWHTESGKNVDIYWRRYMDLDDRFGCVQDVRIETDQRIDFLIESFIDNDVRTNGFDKYIQCSVGNKEDLIYSTIVTNKNNTVVTASKCFSNLQGSNSIDASQRRVINKYSFTLEKEQTLDIHKVSFTASDLYFPKEQLLSIAMEAVKSNDCSDTEQCFDKHASLWGLRWQTADIQIDAEDPPGYNSQLAIRTAIFHLLKAKSLDDRALLCPKGSTTELYFGSVFWDYEIFIQPFYIYNNPDIARTAPIFRYKGLQPARELAKQYGYNGAKYPWQSDRYGNETCVPWQYADHQVHISASVVVGLWHYVMATGDLDYLFDMGAEIVIETARYWVERVDKIPGKPGYQILGVMGPDEYKPITNNNAYTNFVARFNLNLAVKIINDLKTKHPEKYSKLKEKILIDESEIAHFKTVASRISIPKDASSHIIWQCDDFDSLFAEVDIKNLWKDRTRLFGSYLSQEKRYRSKVIKQADVLALIGVFPAAFTKEEKSASFQYYEPFTIHDSSNSMTHRQLNAANLGWKEIAYESWLRAIDIDFGHLPRATDGLHYANIGGMWQQVVFGFCGLASALNSDQLVFTPCLPDQIKSIKFPVIWKGQRIVATVNHDQIIVENKSDEPIEFYVNGLRNEAAAGEQYGVIYQ